MHLAVLEAPLNELDKRAIVTESSLIIVNSTKNRLCLFGVPELFIPESCIQLSFFESSFFLMCTFKNQVLSN